MGVLYKLTFSSGKSYIGVTKKRLAQRLAEHRREARVGRRNLAVYNAWNKYGEPLATVIEEVEDYDLLLRNEITAIAEHNTLTPGGYNLSFGGDTSPMSRPEVAERTKKNRKPWSQEARLRAAAAHRGKIPSAETRARMSAAHKASPRAAANLAKLHARGGRIQSQEEKDRRSAKTKGRKLSAAACRNIIESQRKRHEARFEEPTIELVFNLARAGMKTKEIGLRTGLPTLWVESRLAYERRRVRRKGGTFGVSPTKVTSVPAPKA